MLFAKIDTKLQNDDLPPDEREFAGFLELLTLAISKESYCATKKMARHHNCGTFYKVVDSISKIPSNKFKTWRESRFDKNLISAYNSFRTLSVEQMVAYERELFDIPQSHQHCASFNCNAAKFLVGILLDGLVGNMGHKSRGEVSSKLVKVVHRCVVYETDVWFSCNFSSDTMPSYYPISETMYANIGYLPLREHLSYNNTPIIAVIPKTRLIQYAEISPCITEGRDQLMVSGKIPIHEWIILYGHQKFIGHLKMEHDAPIVGRRLFNSIFYVTSNLLELVEALAVV